MLPPIEDKINSLFKQADEKHLKLFASLSARFPSFSWILGENSGVWNEKKRERRERRIGQHFFKISSN